MHLLFHGIFVSTDPIDMIIIANSGEFEVETCGMANFHSPVVLEDCFYSNE